MSATDVKHYERDGQKYDRITHILDYFATPELVEWKMDVGRKEAGMVSRAALRIGSNVDEAIRAIVNKQKVSKLKTPEAESCYEAWNQWRVDYDVQWDDIATVETLFNDDLMVAGTPDLLWRSRNCIIDVKCSSAIRPSYWLQTEFYARCCGLSNKAVLRLHKGLGTYEFKKMSISDNHWSATVSAINLYRYYVGVTDDPLEGKHECSNSNTAVGVTNAT